MYIPTFWKNADLENTCNQQETKTIFRKYHLGGSGGLDNINPGIGVQDHSGKGTMIFVWSEKEAGTDGGE